MRAIHPCQRLVIVLTCIGGAAAHGQTVVNVTSIAQLRQQAGASNTTVKLASGVYNLSGDTDGNGAGDSRIFLNLTGSNTTFDFTGVEFRVSTRDLRGYGAGNSNGVNLIGVFGSNLSVQGFTLTTYQPGSTAFWSDSETIAVRIGGTNNTVRDASITTGGSSPFGFGDAFGKGAAPPGANRVPNGVPFLSHHKSSGIQVRDGAGTTIDNVDIQMRSFGHGIYMQHTSDVRILNSTVTGELASSNNVVNHPIYDDFVDPDTGLAGVTTYGQPIPANIQISKSEDGVRSYGVESDGVGVTNVHVENVVVRNMREAYSLMDATGVKTVINSEAWGNETGFEPGTNTTIVNSRGDATNGPLLHFRRDNISGVRVNLELVQNTPQVGLWDVAYINGQNNDVTLAAGASTGLPSQSLVRVAQRWNDWRHQESVLDSGFDASALSFINTTGQGAVIGTLATSSGRYTVNAGDALGGFGTMATSQGESIRINSGGTLDPRGALRFSLSNGTLDISPAVSGTNAASLPFRLNAVSNSDTIDILGGLDIGGGLLGLGDFAFDLGGGFGNGTYLLFRADRAITGSLGSGVTSLLGGHSVALTLGGDRRTISLVVTPEPASVSLLVALVPATASRRRRLTLTPAISR